MKITAFFILIPLLLTQCTYYSTKKETPTHSSKQDSIPMQSSTKLPSGLIQLRGRITVSGNYCGGAAPTREMMEEARKPRPKADMRVIVNPTGPYKTDIDGEVWNSTSDAEGYWELKVYPGEYCLKIGEKAANNPVIPPSQPGWVAVDAECYAKWLQTCDRTFRVDEEGNVDANLDIHLYERCFISGFDPCSQYMGPKPP